MVGIFLQNLLSHPLGLRDHVLLTPTARDVVVAKLNAGVEIIRIQRHRFPQFLETLLKALQALKSARKPPMRCGKFVIDLDRIAKFNRSLHKFFCFQIGLTLSHMGGFGLFRISASGENDQRCQRQEEKGEIEEGSSTLEFHSIWT